MGYISPEDLALIEKAFALYGGAEGLAVDFPNDPKYISRVKTGEKRMSEGFRWALEKKIQDKESPIGKHPSLVGEEPPIYDMSQKTVKMKPEVWMAAKELAEESNTSVDGIIQAATIGFIVEHRMKGQLNFHLPALLKLHPAAREESTLST